MNLDQLFNLQRSLFGVAYLNSLQILFLHPGTEETLTRQCCKAQGSYSWKWYFIFRVWVHAREPLSADEALQYASQWEYDQANSTANSRWTCVHASSWLFSSRSKAGWELLIIHDDNSVFSLSQLFLLQKISYVMDLSRWKSPTLVSHVKLGLVHRTPTMFRPDGEYLMMQVSYFSFRLTTLLFLPRSPLSKLGIGHPRYVADEFSFLADEYFMRFSFFFDTILSAADIYGEVATY